jgi:tetratricopeptide (TPR) repeat protein
VAASYEALGLLRSHQDRHTEAEQACRKALGFRRQLAADFPLVIDYRSDLAASHLTLARVLHPARRNEEAVQAARESLDVLGKLATEFPREVAYRQRLAQSYQDLAVLLKAADRPQEADKAMGQAAALREQLAVECPQDSNCQNGLAWFLATCPEPRFRDGQRAVQTARKALALAPLSGPLWHTLGAAHHRAGEDKEALAALEKGIKLRFGGNGEDWVILAMVHARLGAAKEGRRWYDQAVAWTRQYRPHDEELGRFRAEAETLLAALEKKER